MYIVRSIVDTANLEIRECVNCGRLQEVKTNGKSLTVRDKKVVAVAYRRTEVVVY